MSLKSLLIGAVLAGFFMANAGLVAQTHDRRLDSAQTKNAVGASSADADISVNLLDSPRTESSPKITPAQAEISALSANPGTVATDVELEDAQGQLVYSVALNTGAEVKVDANTAKVLFTELSSGNDKDKGENQDDGQSDAEEND